MEKYECSYERQKCNIDENVLWKRSTFPPHRVYGCEKVCYSSRQNSMKNMKYDDVYRYTYDWST